MPLSHAAFQGTERFRLLRLIGQGGMGMVYEAVDLSQQTHVALKVLPLVSPERLLRFKREFRIASEIDHEHLVRLGELVRAGDHWFFTMELVHGVDLLSYVRGPEGAEDLGSQVTAPDSTIFSGVAPRPVPGRAPHPARQWGEACDELKLRRCVLQLAEALCALHRAGCVHRDIKPTNVLVDPSGRTVLLDFGLASVGSADTSMLSAGTPIYMAPEQATQQPTTPASDWYAFGVLLFELLTGRVPFNGHVYEVISAKQTALAPSVRSVAPEAPPDLAALADALLARIPGARPTGDEVLSALGGARRTSRPSFTELRGEEAALVGREPEWAELHQLFERVCSTGCPIALVIRGESGVGKSTLARQFAARLAEREEAFAFRGRCHERELVPFNAVDGLFDAVSHTLRHFTDQAAAQIVPLRAGVLAQVFPVLARVPSIARAELPSGSLDRQEVRSWLFEASRALIRGLAAEKPVLLYVDDLQWADEDSLALLSNVLRAATDLPVLLICTLRTQGGALRSADQRVFSAGVDERTFTLGNLSADSAHRLAAELLAPSALTAAERARIAQESGGHPLFLRELAEEAMAAPDSCFELSLDDVLKRRVGRLQAGPNRVLSALSVAATPVSLGVLRDATRMDSEPFASAVHALRSARLVHLSNEVENDGLDISHERIRRAAREALDDQAVRGLHHALAGSLEASGESVRSAWHWLEAGDRQRAATHYRSAGLRAVQAFAFGEAVSHLRAAKELGRFEPEEECNLCAELADALASAGRGAEAARNYRLAATFTTPARVIELKRRAAEELVRSGYLEEGMLVAREVLSDAQLKVARTPIRALLVERARLKLRGLPSREASAERDVDLHALARIDLCWSFFCGLVLTDHVQGAYFQAKGLNLALSSGDRYRIARAIAAEAAYTASRGPRHRERSRKLFERAEQLAREVQRPQADGTLRLMQGIAAHMNGRFGEAARALGEASVVFRERCTGVSWELDACRQFSLESAFYLGQLRALRGQVEAGLREAEERGSIYSSTNLRTGLANAAWLMDDDPGAARRELTLGMEQWSSRGFHVQHWYELIASVNADLYEGVGEQAFQRVEQRLKALSRSHLLRVSHIAVAAAHLRGRCALAALSTAREPGARRDRLRCVEECERALHDARTPWASALADLLALSRARTSGEPTPDRALTRLRAALIEADCGVFARALDCVVAGDERSLHAEGVRDPVRFARMLVPG